MDAKRMTDDELKAVRERIQEREVRRKALHADWVKAENRGDLMAVDAATDSLDVLCFLDAKEVPALLAHIDALQAESAALRAAIGDLPASTFDDIPDALAGRLAHALPPIVDAQEHG